MISDAWLSIWDSIQTEACSGAQLPGCPFPRISGVDFLRGLLAERAISAISTSFELQWVGSFPFLCISSSGKAELTCALDPRLFSLFHVNSLTLPQSEEIHSSDEQSGKVLSELLAFTSLFKAVSTRYQTPRCFQIWVIGLPWCQTSGEWKTSGCLASSRQSIWMTAWVFHFLTRCLVSCRHKLRLWLHPITAPRLPAWLQIPFITTDIFTRKLCFLCDACCAYARKQILCSDKKTAQPTPKGHMFQHWSEEAGEFQNHYYLCEQNQDAALVRGGGWREKASEAILTTFNLAHSHFSQRILLPGWQKGCFLFRWMELHD